MITPSPFPDKTLEIIRSIDCVAMHPDHPDRSDTILAATQKSITGVLQKFLAAKGITDNRITVKNGFLFLFNDNFFSSWHTLNWWEQRTLIHTFKDSKLYRERVEELLAASRFAPYVNYSDKEVAKSTDQEVKQAWMRKRLLLKECFWNVLDSISYAAYHQKKYQEMYPALCILLCNVTDEKGREMELALGIDNGIGYVYKKKSRESALMLLLYKTFKLFFRKGVFYIGGLELGLLETDSELSCHGSGAVVYQGWSQKKSPA
ncbi:hypothetical protein ACFLYW_01405 [Thermodesulfobacteriota bacterium]